ncbi:exodeoxyribonuclease VII small subunit [Candidatus Laterigemmans baculatus]|uniref:exodeoxyribonuclease VII small subunit n=1 Tax=Candidatus Laterigemmans baculatus TaxID=2770505 RepID=UPI0013DB5541|nr:exodeoxyribonuclease VII small subunit [Candidatus Laterigemmans baculatus]
MAKKKSGGKADAPGSGAVEVAAEAAASFEESLAEVEGIVRELESGQLTLGDSLRAYERGVRELRLCQEQLEKVERRIELLVGFDAEGRPVTQSFDAESLTLEEKQSARGRRRGAKGAGKRGNGGEAAGEQASDGELADDAEASSGAENSSRSRVDDSLGLF